MEKLERAGAQAQKHDLTFKPFPANASVRGAETEAQAKTGYLLK